MHVPFPLQVLDMLSAEEGKVAAAKERAKNVNIGSG